MFRNLKNKRAQAVMGEYLLVIFLVISVVVAMTIYFKRAIQARVHDARDYMVGEVRDRTAGEYDGNLYKEYEPYYTNRSTLIARDSTETKRLLGGATSGIFRKSVNEATSVQSTSETAPPRDFDLTTPVN